MGRTSSAFLALAALLCGSATAYCPDFLRNQTACSCAEYVDGAIIRCDGADGPMMVEKLKRTPIEVRELALENANILEIGAAAFRNLRIKKLVLDNNRIKTIQRDAFQGLEHVLQELSINNNKLQQIPTDAIEGLRALNILSLKCNEIGNLGGYALHGLPSLIEINLGCNKICNIGADAFEEIKPSVQNIILDDNCLTKVPTKAFENMTQLIALHVKYNKIEKLTKHALMNMPSLTMLSLSGNEIDSIDREFLYNVSNLRYFYVAENKIQDASSEVLKQFDKVEIMDLSYNSIPDLVAKQFTVMESVQHLNLEGNNIKEIAAGAFASTPLILLWLPYNCLTNVSADIFQAVPFLKQLSLGHNNILNVQPYSFAHLANLHTVDLSHNKIVTLAKSSLMGPDFMAVRVEENPLVCNQEDGFHVMNGHEAINLTTEPNLVCKTDYQATLKTHQCPTKKPRPAREPCPNQKPKATTAAPTTTAATEAPVPVDPSVPETKAPVVDEKRLVAAMEAAAQMAQQTEEQRRLASAAAAARRLNMDRFMRLARKPTDISVRGHASQPTFLERQRDLLARTEVTEKSKVSSVDSQVEFNEDGSGESVPAEEEAPVAAKP